MLFSVRKNNYPQSFVDYVNVHKDQVYQLSYMLTGNSRAAEEISTEAFLRAYTQTNYKRYITKNHTQLYRIVVDLVTDYLAERKTETGKKKVGKDTLEDSLIALPIRERVKVVLKYIFELQSRDIEAILESM
ncbi:ECF RNA polymerase sigma factor SigW [Halobacillus andaensis]|uniref:ECF RNA polymerase sigma factor SigW n=1 Tax=Halobacillus andaensis TaxID=1176239 RepID=A0A917B714_HALAA|nr:hypothetical protein [Halobacillus andaensis]MBP2005104.1 DNA-directed RNA polymerase specialized sigma24 family protein [Halobacillus andaensis]GGF28912.1 ECF RNA polymerase sigma factor SigW [Halobacillus andaensis]